MNMPILRHRTNLILVLAHAVLVGLSAAYSPVEQVALLGVFTAIAAGSGCAMLVVSERYFSDMARLPRCASLLIYAGVFAAQSVLGVYVFEVGPISLFGVSFVAVFWTSCCYLVLSYWRDRGRRARSGPPPVG